MRESLFTIRRFFFGVIIFAVFTPFISAQELKKVLFDSTKNVFLNTNNNEKWRELARRIRTNKQEHKENLTIVHIGDSHIQGGYFTNRVRQLFCERYGIKERGFVFPYTLIKANGPEDVRFYSSSLWEGQKYNRALTKDKVGISGYHFLMTDSSAKMAISLKQGSEKTYPFNELFVFHNNPLIEVSCNEVVSSALDTIDRKLFVTKLKLFHQTDSVQFRFLKGEAGNQLLGIELRNSKPGIIYHSIGVNGASFETFIKTINYLSILKALQPDCIIISLGTNDCYLGHLDTIALERNIRCMVGNIKQFFPGATILLTTPNDYLIHKKYLNPNLIEASSLIKRISADSDCVCWDFYEVMGRMGASKKWAKNGLMYKDILHLSKEGYKLQGELFFEAFSKAIENVGSQSSNH